MGLSLKGVLSSIAPEIAELLPGPIGGAVRKILGTEIMGDPNASEETIAKLIADKDPAALVKLKEIQLNLTEKLGEQGIELERIAAADRADARNREIKTGDVWTPRILAALVIFAWFLVQYYILTHIVDPAMMTIVVRGLGTLDMAVGMVLGYYFGSSATHDDVKRTEAQKSQ